MEEKAHTMTSLLECSFRLVSQVATAIWTGMAHRESMRLVVDGSCFRWRVAACLNWHSFTKLCDLPTSTIQPPSSHSSRFNGNPLKQTSKRPNCRPLTLVDELDKCCDCVLFVRHCFSLLASVQGLRIARLPIDTRKEEARIDLLALLVCRR